MKLFELVIDDETTDEVFAVSLVSSPAIESPFFAFDKEEFHFAKVQNEKQMLIGAVLIPDKKILRVDGEGKPYSVFFSKQTVAKLAQNYLKKKYTDKTTLEHDSAVKGVHLVESWIKEGKMDKSNLYGLDLPIGTWVGMFKVDNQKIWDEYVKTGEISGFSVEGLFEHKLVEASKIDDIILKDIETLTEFEAEQALSWLRATIAKDNRFKTKKRLILESYSDYPDAVKNNAKRGIELNEKVNNKCATQVGKVRAQQLANGEPISEETIKRMYSYLSRAEEYYDENNTEACGTISYLLWGGLAGKRWSESKLKELGLLQEGEQPSVSSSYPGESKEEDKISRALLD